MPGWPDVVAAGRRLPEVEEGTWFRTPCLRVLVRLAAADPAELVELVEDAWRRVAPKRLVAAYDAGA